MDTFGNDLSSGGQVLSKDELLLRRQRNGECQTCGQKCFQKKLFKMVPLTIPGEVLEGRCLACNPQDPSKETLVAACAPISSSVSSFVNSRSNSGGGRQKSSRRAGGMAASLPPETTGGVSASDLRSSFTRSIESARDLSQSSMGSDEAITPTFKSKNSSSSRDRNRSRFKNAANVTIASSRAKKSLTRKKSRGSEEGMISPTETIDEGGERRKSARGDEYMQKQTPRPSTVIFGDLGLNLDDLDLSDYEEGTAKTSTSGGNNSNPSSRRGSKLSKEDRDALQSLSSSSNSFLDIINIMLCNAQSSTVQNEGLHALSLIHDPSYELLDECADSCGYEVIVSAMMKCCSDATAQTNACKILFIASASGEHHQIAIGEAGGVEALCDAMKAFDEDMIVLEGCLLALSNLCIPEENLGSILDSGLVEMTVEAMSKTVENCGLQEHGCAVLGNLGVHAEALEQIRRFGGCDTIVVSMVVNPMDAEVQSQALVALRNLSARDEENRVLLANAGAIDAVVGAMQCHRDDEKIQERGSWVLSILGMNDDNKLYIGENGGIDVIVRSMWVHPDSVSVQERALRALWTLSVNVQNRYPMVEVNAISAIVTAMQSHAEDDSIQEKGCGTLTNLAATSSKLKIQVVKEGALDVVVMAMVLHGDNQTMQERAVSLMKKVCIPENIERMVAANVSPMMAIVAENFPSCRDKATFVLEQLEGS